MLCQNIRVDKRNGFEGTFHTEYYNCMLKPNAIQ